MFSSKFKSRDTRDSHAFGLPLFSLESFFFVGDVFDLLLFVLFAGDALLLCGSEIRAGDTAERGGLASFGRGFDGEDSRPRSRVLFVLPLSHDLGGELRKLKKPPDFPGDADGGCLVNC